MSHVPRTLPYYFKMYNSTCTKAAGKKIGSRSQLCKLSPPHFPPLVYISSEENKSTFFPCSYPKANRVNCESFPGFWKPRWNISVTYLSEKFTRGKQMAQKHTNWPY